jgi:GGDEF domain-containing protein
MISIKRFLDQRLNGPGLERDIFEALRQMGRLLVDGIDTHTVPGQETDFRVLRRALRALGRQIEEPKSAMALLTSSSEVVEALETYCYRTTEYLREEKAQMHSMVVLLTDTVADISSQTDTSVANLHTIEKELELATGLNDILAVRSNLESCLRALREAAAQHRSSSEATASRMSRALRDHLDMVQKHRTDDSQALNQAEIDLLAEQSDKMSEPAPSSYVAAFKLQRTEHITNRFGAAATHQMLIRLGTELKAVLGPTDRLLRWKGTSFVMFLNTTETMGGVRARLSQAVAKIGMQYIDVGKKSALLAVGVDWTAFPQSDHASLEAALAEVEAFLANSRHETPSPVTIAQR